MDLGVEVRNNTRVGEDVSMDELRSEFDAVFLALREEFTSDRLEVDFGGDQPGRDPLDHRPLPDRVRVEVVAVLEVERQHALARELAPRVAAQGVGAAEAMALLEKESELEEIVRLVGKDSLSPADRLILEVSRTIREDFLHQNAFHEVDTYTSMKKQALMMATIMHFYRESSAALGRGADIDDVEKLPVRERISRMKYLTEEEAAALLARALGRPARPRGMIRGAA